MTEASEQQQLTAEQKARLMSLARGFEGAGEEADRAKNRADLLYDILTCTLPVDTSVITSLPPVLRNLSRKLRSVAGEPLGDLLKNPKTGITVLKRIKEYARESGTAAQSEIEGDVFLAIYYAAIASALVSHDQKITRHSYEDLEQFFGSFAKENWVLGELRDLFTKAREYCESALDRARG